MAVTKLDQDARYSVRGWKGIAFAVHGFPKRFEPDTSLIECDEDDCLCHEDERHLHEIENGGEWVAQDESCGRVLVIMVGDDREHEVDVEDLTKLDEDAFCGSCGQIGCGWTAH